MVEIKTERTFRFEDGVAVAVKKDTWVNGAGKEMSQITEEKGITKDEAHKVVSELIDKERTEKLAELEKLQKQLEDLNKEIAEFENTEEYIKFKEFIDDPKTKDLFSKLNRITSRDKIEGQLKEVNRVMNDVDLWNSQMKGIYEEYSKDE